MAQIKHFDKRVGITYVYESESYYDKEKHQSRSKRKLIGKIDPETGEMVPTGRKGRPTKNTASADGTETGIDYKKLYQSTLEKLERQAAENSRLEQELREQKVYIDVLRSTLGKIATLCSRPDILGGNDNEVSKRHPPCL